MDTPGNLSCSTGIIRPKASDEGGSLTPSLTLCPSGGKERHSTLRCSPLRDCGFESRLGQTLRGDGGMAYAAALGAALCGFKSRSPYHCKSSDSSTDRMLGYEPGDVGSIPPLTTISRFIDNHPFHRSSGLKLVSWRNFTRRWRNGIRSRLKSGSLRVQVPLSAPLFSPHAPRGSAAHRPTDQPISSCPDTRYSKLYTLIFSRPLAQPVRAGSL